MKSFIKAVMTLGIVCAPYLVVLSCKPAQQNGGQFKKLDTGGEVNGPRSVENVLENLRLVQPRFDHYYQSRLKDNPALEGMVEVIFDVDEDGSIVYVNLGKATTKDPVFEDMILAGLSNHKFDQWNGGRGKTEVVYQFSFQPKPAQPPQPGAETTE